MSGEDWLILVLAPVAFVVVFGGIIAGVRNYFKDTPKTPY